MMSLDGCSSIIGDFRDDLVYHDRVKSRELQKICEIEFNINLRHCCEFLMPQILFRHSYKFGCYRTNLLLRRTLFRNIILLTRDLVSVFE